MGMNIVIVGGGIDGLASAWQLTKRGHKVTLLEQGPIPNPLAASGDHHRIIRRAYEEGSGYTAAMSDAFAAWDEMFADIGANHLDRRGFLCVSHAEGDEAETYRKALDAGGFAYELLDRDTAAALYPFLEPAPIRYALHSAEGGALHCKRIAIDLAKWLRANGCDVRENTPVASVDEESGTVRLAGGQTLTGDLVVVAAGGWTPILFPDVAGTLTVYRTAVVYLDPPADLAEAWARAPVLFGIGGMVHGYVLPPSGGGGLKFGAMPHVDVKPDATHERVPRPGEGETIREFYRPAFRRIDDYAVREVVTCNFVYTADEKFWCRKRGKTLVVSACSGHGYKFGAAVGRWVADGVESGDYVKLLKRLRAET